MKSFQEFKTIVEEVEQIDELSKNLLSRYKDKAADDRHGRIEADVEKGEHHQRIRSLLAAKNYGDENPLSKKNAPEVHKHLSKAYDEWQKIRQPDQDKIKRREKGEDLAIAKMGGKGKKNISVPATGKIKSKHDS